MNEYKRLIIKLNLVKNVFRLEIVKDKKVLILKKNKDKRVFTKSKKGNEENILIKAFNFENRFNNHLRILSSSSLIVFGYIIM
jgi:hypothetical protein